MACGALGWRECPKQQQLGADGAGHGHSSGDVGMLIHLLKHQDAPNAHDTLAPWWYVAP